MKKVSLFWKTYFWILLVLMLLSFAGSLTEFSQWKGGNWSSKVESSLMLLGLFSYVFAKKIFPANFWKIVFWFLIGFLVLDTIYYNVPLNEVKQILSFRAFTHNPSLIEQLIGLALILPAFYTIYQVAYKNNYLKTSQAVKVAENKKEFKRINVIWLIILTIITLELYIPFWFIRQKDAINSLHSPEKIYKNTFIIIFIIFLTTLIVSIMSTIVLRLIGYEGIGKDIDYIIKWVNLIPGVILLFQIFKVRRIFIDHFNDYLKKDIWISGLLTFLFHIYYFQYLINKHTKS